MTPDSRSAGLSSRTGEKLPHFAHINHKRAFWSRKSKQNIKFSFEKLRSSIFSPFELSNTGIWQQRTNMAAIFCLSWMTVLFTVYMYLSGISTCSLLFRSRTTRNISFVPFITTVVNIVMWLTYGVLCYDTAIVIVNCMGLVVQLTYISIYIYFSPSKIRPMQQIVAGVAFLVALYIYISQFVPSRASALKQVGLVASIVTILMFISPICDMVHCIRVKSARTISISLTIATLISSSLWLTYGLLLNDTFIALPNVPGLLSGVSRLLILLKFKDRDDTNEAQSFSNV